MLITYKNKAYKADLLNIYESENYSVEEIKETSFDLNNNDDTDIKIPKRIIIDKVTGKYKVYIDEIIFVVDEECYVIYDGLYKKNAMIIKNNNQGYKEYKNLNVKAKYGKNLLVIDKEGDEETYYLFNIKKCKKTTIDFDYIKFFEEDNQNLIFTAVQYINETDFVICLLNENGKIISQIYDTVNNEYHNSTENINMLCSNLYEQLRLKNKSYQNYSRDLKKRIRQKTNDFTKSYKERKS